MIKIYLTCDNHTCVYTVQYELHLSASDNLKENHTIVVIHVKDVNDNPPVFERPTYRTQITEEDDRNLPKRVLQVRRAFANAHVVFFFISRFPLCMQHVVFHHAYNIIVVTYLGILRYLYTLQSGLECSRQPERV